MTNDKLADWLKNTELKWKCDQSQCTSPCKCSERLNQVLAALRRPEPATEAVLEEALTRMDRAREILRGPNANWGMLDTSDLRAALKVKAASPERSQSGESGSATVSAEQKAQMTEALYYELLYAVGNKYPDETRHQTALRYIRNAEKPSTETSQLVAAEAERGKT